MTCTSSPFSPSSRRRSSNDNPFTVATFCAGNSSSTRSPWITTPARSTPLPAASARMRSFAETGRASRSASVHVSLRCRVNTTAAFVPPVSTLHSACTRAGHSPIPNNRFSVHTASRQDRLQPFHHAMKTRCPNQDVENCAGTLHHPALC